MLPLLAQPLKSSPSATLGLCQRLQSPRLIALTGHRITLSKRVRFSRRSLSFCAAFLRIDERKPAAQQTRDFRYGSNPVFRVFPQHVRLGADSVAKLGCICQRSSSVSFCRALSRSPVEGAAASTHQHQRLTQRLQRASDCDRRWGTAEEVNEPPQVLRGCGEQHLVPRAAQASQSKPVEPEVLALAR